MQIIRNKTLLESEASSIAAADMSLSDHIIAAFNHTSAGILHVGFGGEIRCFNKRILKILNIGFEESQFPSPSDIIRYSQKSFKNSKDLESLFTIPIKDYFHPQELLLETFDGRVLFCNSQPIIKDELINGVVWSVTDITEHKIQERMATHRSLHDPLTQLPNRSYLFEKLESLTDRILPVESPFSLLFLDLDDFKAVNDQYGHNVGDQVLINFASKLQSALRVPDILCRLSGDEFIVILDGVNTQEDIEPIIQRIYTSLEGLYQIPDFDIPVSVSIGAASYPTNSIHARELLRQADKAMYMAKRKGKNTFCFYNSSCDL